MRPLPGDQQDHLTFLEAGWPSPAASSKKQPRCLVKDLIEVIGEPRRRRSRARLRALEGNCNLDDYFDLHLKQQKQHDHSRRYPEPYPTRIISAVRISYL
jgi:hypothetical protein